MSHNETSDLPRQMGGAAVFGHLDLPAEWETESPTQWECQKKPPRLHVAGVVTVFHSTDAKFTYRVVLYGKKRGNKNDFCLFLFKLCCVTPLQTS